IACALLVIFGIAYVAGRNPAASPGNSATGTPAVTASTTGGGYTIEEVPLPTLESIEPDLNHTAVFRADVPSDVRVTLAAQVSQLSQGLKNNPTDASAWLNLALAYDEAEDYAAARDVWVFLTKAIPDDPTSYENLGKLYHFDLKDFPKAETYFKE